MLIQRSEDNMAEVLACNPELGDLFEARSFIEPEKNFDGWWDSEQLCKQMIEQTLPLVKALFPGKQILFLFDHSTVHGSFAAD